MLDYDSIKAMAKAIKRPVKQLLALSPGNDPFYAGVGHRGEAAEWFAGIWAEHSAIGRTSSAHSLSARVAARGRPHSSAERARVPEHRKGLDTIFAAPVSRLAISTSFRSMA